MNLAKPALLLGASVGVAALGGYAALREVLRGQARAARAAIGKPLGEDAHRADRTYKKKYGNRLHLVLLGDSIAAGLGAEAPEDTLGAQLAKRLARRTHRSVRLVTAARVGSESSELAAQLDTLPPDLRIDVAVIVVGGNDVTHRIPAATAARHLGDALARLREREVRVVVGTCPDLSALDAVKQPLRGLAGRSSRTLAAAQQRVALEYDAWVVSLSAVVGPFFLAQPDSMFSVDRFHPSGAGYRRLAKALLPSVMAALDASSDVPFGHVAPHRAVRSRAATGALAADR